MRIIPGTACATPMHRVTALLTVLFFFSSPGSLSAQTVGTCAPGAASADLDVANVRARVFNSGGLFFQGGSPVYEQPKGSGITAIFASNLWVGGRVNGDLRVSAATYADREFWPGPLADQAIPPADCSVYDRIWKVSDSDIRTYDDGGAATQDMIDWPWDLGAPVSDGDGNPDNYDLAAGDRPYVYGDQTLWWVMNDAGNAHIRTGSLPIGLEVRGAAFAVDDPRGGWLPDATFYRFELVNRNAVEIRDMYFGLWSDVDLGNFRDDYIGSDSLLGLGFGYNGDDLDEGDDGYGAPPPAIGHIFVRGPVADADGIDNDGDGAADESGERRRATAFVFYNSDATIQGGPTLAIEYYRYLIPRWRDGSRITRGGSGWGFSSSPVSFMYSGHPPAFWSEDNLDGQGLSNTPSDRRFVLATGPFDMAPGGTEEVVVAILWARGADRHDSVALLKTYAADAYGSIGSIMEFNPSPTTTDDDGPPVDRLAGVAHYPNPARSQSTVEVTVAEPGPVRLRLYDMLGREVRTVVHGFFAAGSHVVHVDVSTLAAGVYYYRLEFRRGSAASRVVVAGSP